MGDDFKLQSRGNILTFRGLFNFFFVVWYISMFFNIVSTARSTREVQVTNVAMKLVLVSLIDKEHLLTNENSLFKLLEYLVLYLTFLSWVAMLKSSKKKKILLKRKLLFKKWVLKSLMFCHFKLPANNCSS